MAFLPMPAAAANAVSETATAKGMTPGGSTVPWGAIAGLGAGVVSGLSGLSAAKDQASLAKLNANMARREGEELFSQHLQNVQQQISSYVVSRGTSGVYGQSQQDVMRSAEVKGSRDAARIKFQKDVEAARYTYQGKSAKAQATSGLGMALLSGAAGFIGAGSGASGGAASPSAFGGGK